MCEVRVPPNLEIKFTGPLRHRHFVTSHEIGEITSERLWRLLTFSPDDMASIAKTEIDEINYLLVFLAQKTLLEVAL